MLLKPGDKVIAKRFQNGMFAVQRIVERPNGGSLVVLHRLKANGQPSQALDPTIVVGENMAGGYQKYGEIDLSLLSPAGCKSGGENGLNAS